MQLTFLALLLAPCRRALLLALPPPARERGGTPSAPGRSHLHLRSHGIANFPNPVSNGKGISIPPMSGVNPSSQRFQSAQQACQSLMPGAGGAS